MEGVCPPQPCPKPLAFVSLISFDSVHLFLPGQPLACSGQHHFSSGACFLNAFPCIHFRLYPNCLPNSKEEIICTAGFEWSYTCVLVQPHTSYHSPLVRTPPLVPDFLHRVALPLATDLCMGCLSPPHLICLTSVHLPCTHDHVPVGEHFSHDRFPPLADCSVRQDLSSSP